jgi:hypothetical protein
MLTLAATQSSTWGYSAKTHTITGLTSLGGTSTNTGSFTKPILAPNGKLYSIMTCPSAIINSITQTNVILEITPGTSNTATTNYSAPTFNFIYSDNTVAQNGSGFAKPSWDQGTATALQAFNGGILAPNGLIYFVPFDNQAATNKWIIFSPNSGRWKIANIHPNYAEGATSYIPNAVITTAVLGTDGKIYVFGYGTGLVPYYRFTPTSNASGDTGTIETGFYQNVGLNSTPLCNINMQWKNSAGNSYTDTPVNTVIKAYDNSGASGRPYEKVRTFIDIIVHPSGKIYFIPGAANVANGASGGRGRIFYLNINAWGSATELVSATGLVAPGGKNISAHYAFLEKPRDANHDKNTLKIYIVPTKGLYTTTTVCKNILCIDPVTNTISEIAINYSSDPTSTIGKRISLSNGLNIFYNVGSGAGVLSKNRSGGHLLTGWDVPNTDTDGGVLVNPTGPGILHNTSPASFGEPSPGYSLIGGGSNVPYPHHSKFISYPGALTTISELISIKEYGPGITNFNFEDRDKVAYAPPTDLGGLKTSLFNSNFNKPK